MAGGAFDVVARPGVVTSNMLATLRTGEFHIGHKVLAFWNDLMVANSRSL
jgi:hypothetical protein